MHVSIRDHMLGSTGISDPVEAMKELGLESLELAVGDGPVVGTFPRGDEPVDLGSKDDLDFLQATLDENGLSVCALLMANDFSSDDYEGEVEELIVTCRAAERLGVPTVRIDLIPHQGEMAEGRFIERSARAARRALAECTEVKLGIENHGGTSNRPDFLRKMFDATGEDRLGLTLDTGNFYWFGHPLQEVYELMERYASRVYHTHCKNINYPEDIREERREVGFQYGEYVCPIYKGDVDHKKVVEILTGVGYEGSLCIEDECLGRFDGEERADVLQKDVDYLKSLV